MALLRRSVWLTVFFFRCLGTAGDFQEYKKSIQKEFNAPKKEKAKKEKKEKA